MGLGERLTEAGIVTHEQWEEAERTAASQGGFVGAVLVDRGFVAADLLSRFLEEGFGIPTIAGDGLKPNRAACELAPLNLWHELCAVPLARAGDVLTVALARPLDVFVLDRLKKELGTPIRPVLADPEQLLQVLSSLAPQLEARGSRPEPVTPPAGVTGATEAPPEVREAAEEDTHGGLSEVRADDDIDRSAPAEVAVPDQPATAVEEGSVPEEVPRDVDRRVDTEALDEILRRVEDGLGWVIVVGEADHRTAFVRALRSTLEERGRRVVCFSSAERPYGELEGLEPGSNAIVVLEDLDALEGHVPEQALLLREVEAAHERGLALVAGASAPPTRLRSLEPSLRVAVSLARVFPLGQRVPGWLDGIVREAAGLIEEAGDADVAADVSNRLSARDITGSMSLAVDGCKSLLERT